MCLLTLRTHKHLFLLKPNIHQQLALVMQSKGIPIGTGALLMSVKTASYPTQPTRESGFKHLTEAMVINIKRGVEYSRMTQGRSLMVTVPLVLAEFVSLFIAIIFDLWGMFYNARGINIVAGDYVPMSQAKPIDAPLRQRKVAPAHIHEELSKTIKNYQSECLAAISAGRYAACWPPMRVA